MLVGDDPEGHVAERQRSEPKQAQYDELGPRHRGLDSAVHEAQNEDGDDADDDEQGKVAHDHSNREKDIWTGSGP